MSNLNIVLKEFIDNYNTLFNEQKKTVEKTERKEKVLENKLTDVEKKIFKKTAHDLYWSFDKNRKKFTTDFVNTFVKDKNNLIISEDEQEIINKLLNQQVKKDLEKHPNGVIKPDFIFNKYLPVVPYLIAYFKIEKIIDTDPSIFRKRVKRDMWFKLDRGCEKIIKDVIAKQIKKDDRLMGLIGYAYVPSHLLRATSRRINTLHKNKQIKNDLS